MAGPQFLALVGLPVLALASGLAARGCRVAPSPGLSRVHALWLHARKATDAAVELGATLYPPLDKAEVQV